MSQSLSNRTSEKDRVVLQCYHNEELRMGKRTPKGGQEMIDNSSSYDEEISEEEIEPPEEEEEDVDEVPPSPVGSGGMWLVAMVGGAVSPGCHVGAVPVPLVVIILCHFVGNNKMKRLHTFLPAEVGALYHSFWSSLGCSRTSLCIISVSFLPHFLTCITVVLPSTILHLRPIVVLGAGFLFFCQWGKGAYLAGSPSIPFCHPGPK